MIWVLVTFLTILFSYFSVKNNQNPEYYWAGLVWLVGALPVWPILSKVSTDLVRDALIYDLIIYIIGLGTIVYLTNSKLEVAQITGIVVMLLGFLITHIK